MNAPMLINVFDYLLRAEAAHPDKPAFCDEARCYTYRELLHAACAQGTRLAQTYGCVNRPIAVGVERTADTVAALQGVLASGNHYVAIDLTMPAARMRSILAQVQPVCFLVSADAAQKLQAPPCPVEVFCFDGPAEPALLAQARRQVLDIDPIYILFTSGSTGTPKGIVISHRGVIDFTEWLADIAGFTAEDRFANQSPFYFDTSVKDMYQTLRAGATCHILPKKLFLFPKLLIGFLNEKKITAITWATSAFHLVANSGVLTQTVPETLRTVILGGETLQAKQLRLWRSVLPNATFINNYGPTEVTVDCSYYIIDRDFDDQEPIPIGRACENKQILLLDEQLRPVAPGEPGEICVRGGGLALGYFADPEKNEAAFVRNPNNPHYPERIYRTGDVGVCDADGLIYFRARKDHQIKHMGYRIEFGEIETAINSLTAIREAVCLFDSVRDKLIVCYSGDLDTRALIRAAAELLPKYMLPNICHQLAQLPHNANGKIDRVALRQRYLP